MADFNSSRVYLEAFVRDAADLLSAGALVLDAGAGDCRHARYFGEHRYESADLCTVDKRYGELTYTCDLAAIPVDDGRFDAVVCTQVLEHVPEPQTVLQELHRVLKPGGKLFLTVPLFYPEHEIPYDFQRFTRYGLERLLGLSHFDDVQIEWLEGYLGTLSYQTRAAAAALPTFREARSDWKLMPWVPASMGLRVVLNRVADALGYGDTIHKVTTRGHCKNYAVVATKP